MQVLSFDIGIRHLAYCLLDKPTKNIVAWDLLDLGCSKREGQKIVDRVLELLDDIYYNKTDHGRALEVLIESQMTSVMKNIQTAINTFFKVVAKYTGHDITTRYVSGKLKLSFIEKYPGYCEPVSISLVSGYKRNKLVSSDFTKWYLQKVYSETNKDTMIGFLSSLKKTDDVCDAFLMALCNAYI
jgi:hypothetical protein